MRGMQVAAVIIGDFAAFRKTEETSGFDSVIRSPCLRQNGVLPYGRGFRQGRGMSDSTTIDYRFTSIDDQADRLRERLMGGLYPALEQIAAARLRKERNCSLSTGDLINEVMVQMLARERVDPIERAHMIALSSRMMRNILIDQARAKQADKRQHEKVELTTRVSGDRPLDLQTLEVALMRLNAIDPALMELVEMRYFGGMSVTDVALATGLSEATVKRRWQTARAWLVDALNGPLDAA